MTKEVIVESFELDHTAVKAPYVRLIGEETGPKGGSSLPHADKLILPSCQQNDSFPLLKY